ncbi:hypothetical protein JOC95_001770 [Bacillus tianshenii]|uniref:Uncharacterized protein n=1 Tax=Sutcliffiella tianshenii TaxID=1463404 RepID=A0ABS2NZY1_9BACI|nr:hypothetical protein [Bacillus tianshenii]
MTKNMIENAKIQPGRGVDFKEHHFGFTVSTPLIFSFT